MNQIADAPQGPVPADLHDLVGHSLLAGLCPLVPIPLLDDWLRDMIRRHQARRLTRAAGLHLDPPSVEVLACGFHPLTAMGCVRTTVLWPFRFLSSLLIKKILRRIIFVLAIKDCADSFSEVFHEAYLLRHALRRGQVSATDAAARLALRRHIEIVRDEVDHRPVERWAKQAFRASRRLLAESARSATRLLRRRLRTLPDDEAFEALRQAEAPGFDAVVDELTDEILSESGYLQDLERRLDERLAARLSQEAAPGPAGQPPPPPKARSTSSESSSSR